MLMTKCEACPNTFPWGNGVSKLCRACSLLARVRISEARSKTDAIERAIAALDYAINFTSDASVKNQFAGIALMELRALVKSEGDGAARDDKAGP